MNSSVTMASVYQQVMPATLGPTVVREKTTVDVEVHIFKIMHSSRYLSTIFITKTSLWNTQNYFAYVLKYQMKNSTKTIKIHNVNF